MFKRYMTIEEKYGVEQGDDWFAVYMNSPFKREQRVIMSHSLKTTSGIVVDVRFGTFVGQQRYDILVKYDNQQIPRWTHPQWLRSN